MSITPGPDPVSIGTHVAKHLRQVKTTVEKRFKLVKQYDDFTYLGMSIKRNRANRTIDINMGWTSSRSTLPMT